MRTDHFKIILEILEIAERLLNEDGTTSWNPFSGEYKTALKYTEQLGISYYYLQRIGEIMLDAGLLVRNKYLDEIQISLKGLQYLRDEKH